ncbi:CG7330 [Drosophila busckii]|uniref:CG7330 n=1 Tax=Drosophila busckii TaxID=30019 RepID=A0A0M3QWY9_DROBS|nr:CG7330 [Drosophila busckii]
MNLRNICTLTLLPTLYVLLVLLLEFVEEGLAQNPDPLFELPVQLVGFPVIVLSVRLSQFARKLAYSLSPSTYRSRSRRNAAQPLALDAELAQKEILREFGPRACIFEEPCRVHASRPGSQRRPGSNQQATAHAAWAEVLSNYKVQSTEGMKQWYLLSLFIGDAVRDVPLCKHLAKRLPCPGVGPLPPPQPR